MPSALGKKLQKRIKDTIYATFAEAYQKANEYYDQNKGQECIDACDDILDQDNVPRFLKIETLILLALVVDGEEDFEEARTEAGT